MNFCTSCGARVELRLPEHDSRQRFVCTRCAHIHYQNPRVVAGCVPIWNDGVLLCRRAIEPRKGLWTLPAGFLELEETTEECALRETREEANAEVTIQSLYRIFELSYISQIYVIYLGCLRSLEFSPGEETQDVMLFRFDDVPWDELAFAIVELTLRSFFSDREQETHQFRVARIRARGANPNFLTVLPS